MEGLLPLEPQAVNINDKAMAKDVFFIMISSRVGLKIVEMIYSRQFKNH